jgi:hypothetical protein
MPKRQELKIIDSRRVANSSSGSSTSIGAHTHAGTDITSQVSSAASADSAPWSGITGKPTTFTPSAHTHAGTDITSQVADADKVDGHHANAFVLKTLFDAQSILAATTDDTPAALTIAENRIVGRKTGGNVAALTAAEVAAIIQAAIDHGSLAGLSNDNHAQYALLSGRPGGQTITGGTGSGNNLVLNSTSHATKGNVLIQTAGGNVGIGVETPSSKLHVVGKIIASDVNATNGAVLVQANYATNTYPAQALITEYSSGGIALSQYMYQSNSSVWKSSYEYGNIGRGALIVSLNTLKFLSAPFQNVTAGNDLTTQPTTKFYIADNGNAGFSTESPTISDGVGIDINGRILRLRTSKTPASATATGNVGEICWDSNYVYVCTATNTWKRAALSTW